MTDCKHAFLYKGVVAAVIERQTHVETNLYDAYYCTHCLSTKYDPLQDTVYVPVTNPLPLPLRDLSKVKRLT